MKKILIALMVIGVSHFSAEAKTKKNSSKNPNYKVCPDQWCLPGLW